MYYEEQIINGVVHFRTTPDGQFLPLSAVQLTMIIIQLRKQLDELMVRPKKQAKPIVNPVPVHIPVYYPVYPTHPNRWNPDYPIITCSQNTTPLATYHHSSTRGTTGGCQV